MAAKLLRPKSSIESMFGVIRAPFSFILDKIDDKKQDAARKSIWKKSTSKPESTRNRRLLDIAALNFDDSFIIGLPEIDNQHKFIMIAYNNIVNDAQRFRRSKSATSIITERFRPLFRIIGDHFADEESIMRSFDYPGLIDHICQHDQFMCDTLSMIVEAETCSIGLEQIIFVVGAWISGHILISDKYFGDFLMSREGG